MFIVLHVNFHVMLHMYMSDTSAVCSGHCLVCSNLWDQTCCLQCSPTQQDFCQHASTMMKLWLACTTCPLQPHLFHHQALLPLLHPLLSDVHPQLNQRIQPQHPQLNQLSLPTWRLLLEEISSLLQMLLLICSGRRRQVGRDNLARRGASLCRCCSLLLLDCPC